MFLPLRQKSAGKTTEELLSKDWTGGRLNQGPLFFGMRVQAGYPREGGGRVGLGKILVPLEPNGNADFGRILR
jgi:hypothetical protein